MTLPLKKIYIDSRYRTDDSESSSNFKFQLPYNVYLPENTFFYIDDISIPHAWYSVETGLNDTIYISYVNNGNTTYTTMTIAAGYYTASTFATALVSLFTGLAGTTGSNPFNVLYDHLRNRISIKCPTILTSFKIWTDEDLAPKKGLWQGPEVDPYNYASFNTIIKNFGTSYNITTGQTFYTGYIDLALYHNIYLTSPTLGSFNTLGARGEANIIRKIGVISDYGTVLYEKAPNADDYLECSKQTLSTMEFSLRDVNGNVIPLNESNMSFSIVFVRKDL